MRHLQPEIRAEQTAGGITIPRVGNTHILLVEGGTGKVSVGLSSLILFVLLSLQERIICRFAVVPECTIPVPGVTLQRHANA